MFYVHVLKFFLCVFFFVSLLVTRRLTRSQYQLPDTSDDFFPLMISFIWLLSTKNEKYHETRPIITGDKRLQTMRGRKRYSHLAAVVIHQTVKTNVALKVVRFLQDLDCRYYEIVISNMIMITAKYHENQPIKTGDIRLCLRSRCHHWKYASGSQKAQNSAQNRLGNMWAGQNKCEIAP